MVISPIYWKRTVGYLGLKGGIRMSFKRLEKWTDGCAVVEIKGKFGATLAINIVTVLEEAISNRVTRLTLDFSAVSHFDYQGIILLVSVLDFYGRHFSGIMCWKLPQNISGTLKGLGAENIPGVEIVSTDEPKALTVGDLQFIPISNLN